MTATKPNRQWSGCQMCKPHKNKTLGQAERKPLTELRKIGKKRKVSRHDLGDMGQ